MIAPLWERFKFWVCDTFGHSNKSKHDVWEHDGQIHYVCKRCNRIVSKNK